LDRIIIFVINYYTLKMKNYLLVLLTVFFAMSFKSDNGGLKVGSIAPVFTIKDVNGKEVTLNDYKGKVVLIDFWASWCKQCRLESPKLVKAYQKYRHEKFEDGVGFEIISVALDDDSNDWKSAVAQDGYNWTNVSEGKKWDADIAKLYMVTSLPTNYLIDGDGKIIEKDLRGNMLENVLSAIKK
jgi:thiol-disulfide isomerase/thioredoxin